MYFAFLQYHYEAFWDAFQLLDFDTSIYFYQNKFVDTLWVFSVLSLVLHYANVHFVNKINVILLIFMMMIFSIIAAFIQQTIIVYYYEIPIFPIIIIVISSVISCALLYSLLIYYLTNFFEKYFIKSKQSFAITATNSSTIHFILFSTFIGFILIKGYELITNAFDLMLSGFQESLYIGAILLGLFLSKSCFKQPFNKIQSEKLIKSISVSAMMIFICDILYFTFMYKMPIRYYINADVLIHAGRSLLLLVLLIMLICLIINKVTKHYFLKQK
ncbi:hypothetical protein A9G45_06275 [Gilliamella sp. HK2]|uniref:hypothetical protein n=2 Tax=unclassified Gilliamella TaxID=2685620 RepID=UPI00080E578C|nr:hypothetical protein [Gilliamella apicola]OCG28759.1 hypothetical protein A9G45_06275 [Gilliamella apicola]OCG30101.1 hypothetical protein A9G46_12045 [Gilliamella apicola]